MDEEFLSKKRAIELFDSGDLARLEVGTTKDLQDIHRCLFQDVFDFAGEIRTVDLAKGNFRFAPAIYLADTLKTIDRPHAKKAFGQVCRLVPSREGNLSLRHRALPSKRPRDYTSYSTIKYLIA